MALLRRRDPDVDLVRGFQLFAGTSHAVFFQDGPAIGAKCDLASTLGLAGISIWRLGGEEQDIWDAIRARR